MIQLKDLRKSYTTGSFQQKALDGVTLNLRDNEFVAVLGPSGSGKTTLLNVLGGLDTADSGEIVINGVSTASYKSADWDTYRNHRIGFIFQSYNLIPHQSVLANVELALTLAGVGSAERKTRATEALERVGLGEHINKKPSQLSGGQMQRVAIARALVNNPSIVLADEPTGALDTETGVAVMDLLKEIANDRLVVMVTHNPELAEEYATRIVRLADGRIVDDSNPYEGEEELASSVVARSAVQNPHIQDSSCAALLQYDQNENFAMQSATADASPSSPATAGVEDISSEGVSAAPSLKQKRARMNFLTALGLSFNNLMTKKGRTFMTAFAGSIGIIGIAAILSLSNGVNNYIAETEEQALTSYPLTITKSSFDFSGLLSARMGTGSEASEEEELSNVEKGFLALQGQQNEGPEVETVTGAIEEVPMMTQMFSQVKNNNLKEFKVFLDSEESGIRPYVHTVQYSYGIVPNIYKADTSEGIVQLNPSSIGNTLTGGVDGSAFGITGTGSEVFNEMMDNRELLESYMDVVAGHWPEKYDECLLVLSSTGRIMDYTLYSIGYYDTSVMDKMAKDTLDGKEVVAPETSQDFSVQKALQMEFSVVPSSSLYQYNAEQKLWTNISNDEDIMKKKVAEGVRLKVVGVVQPKEDSSTTTMQQGIAYTPELTEYLINQAEKSEIVSQQRANKDVDVFTGEKFEDLRNSGGSDFDFGSMFEIDEDAMNSAFSMDTSALDFGNITMDPSALAIDPNAVQIDPNALQVNPNDMANVLSADAMAQTMQNAPQFEIDQNKLLDSLTNMPQEQQDAINAASAAIVEDFQKWAQENPTRILAITTNPGPVVQEYLQTERARKLLEPVADQASAVFEEQFNAAVQDYMEKSFIPYFSEQMQTLMVQAGSLTANQLAAGMSSQMAQATQTIGTTVASAISEELQRQMSTLQDTLGEGFSFDTDAFANAISFNMTQDDLTDLLMNLMNADELSFDGNMKKLGYAQTDSPESISIYPVSFEAKESVLGIIDGYNNGKKAVGKEDEAIQYSDFAGVLMSSVTNIIDAISLVLIAFVSISLVVSSIMISIITYISVLERKKEIGILRAMGASKGNIANVFNAETFIEGLIAGVLAIAVVLAVSVPVNIFVEAGWGVPHVMTLPWQAALALIGISVLLTFLAGLIPSQAASRRDPVEALRAE